MATMADIVRGLNTPSGRDRIVIYPAANAGMITVGTELHRSPFVYESGSRHFSFQQMPQAVAYANELAATSGLYIEGEYPAGCGLPGGSNSHNWSEEPTDEDYRELCEPEEPAAGLRFLHRWGHCNASANQKFQWQIRRDPELPEWACTEGERFYWLEVA